MNVIVDTLNFIGNCQTTAMGIMPHIDIEKALVLSLSLDIPFWPQLPHVSYYDDMYVQASENFPGIIVDVEKQRLSLNTARFNQELPEYARKMANLSTFTFTKEYSAVYRRFLAENLSKYPAIRGQMIGPVSFGFKVFDENNIPIIYNDSIRTVLFDFLSRKINAQYAEMKEHNKNAFVWLDEPGLGWIFSGLSGYDDTITKREYQEFLGTLSSPGALHLCASVNLPYLLSMPISLLSFDAYQIEILPRGYTESIAKFIKNGGVIAWGIVPTDSTSLGMETPESLFRRLNDYWGIIAANTDITINQVARQALIAPARCCLKNIGRVGAANELIPISLRKSNFELEVQLVENAFMYLKKLSRKLRDEFDLSYV